MKRLHSLLGIATICFFIYYLTQAPSPYENDLERLSEMGHIDFIDGRVYLTLTDSLLLDELKMFQQLEMIYDIILIEPVIEAVSSKDNTKPREPP